MFDFLDSDWFNIALQIIFIVLIYFDIKKYKHTKKNEHILNIVLTIVFGIWALYPYYNSYFGWNDKEKSVMISNCDSESNKTLCKCLDDKTFKEYTFKEYKNLDKNGSNFKSFLKDAKDDCLDDSWF